MTSNRHLDSPYIAELMTRSDYQSLSAQLNKAGISLRVVRRPVKNINFRLKPNLLSISVLNQASHASIIAAIFRRLDWALTRHPILVANYQAQRQRQSASVLLWGQPQALLMSESQKLTYYRQALTTVLPELFDKWQPIVGQWVKEYRIKKMTTRWGSCNIKARRVWLSVYLPAYPIECTEYVIVHELCHLHHANHSPDFWSQVACAMPQYRQWHDMLLGKVKATLEANS